MNFSAIKYEVSNQVALINLNRPDRMNAWNALMTSEPGNALGLANSDDEVRAVLLTGAGRC